MNQNDWQLIETAPRDGTMVLGYVRKDEDSKHILCWFNPSYQMWIIFMTRPDHSIPLQPTHWMPLPKGPE